MHRKVNYGKFVLCKNPYEKTPIRREVTIFPKVSKMAIFRKIAEGGLRQIFQKWLFFFELRKAKKIGITSRK